MVERQAGRVCAEEIARPEIVLINIVHKVIF